MTLLVPLPPLPSGTMAQEATTSPVPPSTTAHNQGNSPGETLEPIGLEGSLEPENKKVINFKEREGQGERARERGREGERVRDSPTCT